MTLAARLGLFIFSLFTLLLSLFYFSLLWDKIQRPNFKNLSAEGFIQWGIVLALMWVISIIWIRRIKIFSKKTR